MKYLILVLLFSAVAGRGQSFDIVPGDSTPETVMTYEGYGMMVYAACFSPDGRLVLTVTSGTVKLWTREGRLLTVIRAAQRNLTAYFLPDGRHLLTAYEDTVQVYDLQGNSIRLFTHNESFYPLQWMRRDSIVIRSGDSAGIVRQTGLRAIGRYDAFVFLYKQGRYATSDRALFDKVSAGGRYGLSCDRGGDVRLTDSRRGIELTYASRRDRGEGSLMDAALSADGRYILSAFSGGVVRLQRNPLAE